MQKPKKTCSVQTRPDIRTIACLLQFYSENGILIRSKSDLVSSCLEDYKNLLVSAGRAREFSYTDEALRYIEPKLGELNTDRTRRALIAQLREEDTIRETIRAHISGPSQESAADAGIVSQEALQKALQRMKEEDKEKENG